MTETTLSLIEAIEKETVHYRRLTELGEAQRGILVSGKMEPLNENIRLQEKEVFALGPLVSARVELLEKMGRQTGQTKLDLKEALRLAPAGLSGRMREVVGRLLDAVKKLDETNRVNGKLLGNAASFASFTLEAIRGTRKKSTFSPMAKTESEKPSFVNRVV
ncbi:MAG TPA: flagellar protein FlgN [bacterium]|nr:flagellar protein FlgN [bacterium]